MTPEIAILQSQIATIQANVEWLMKLVWAMIALNAASFLTNGYTSAMIHRNNKREG